MLTLRSVELIQLSQFVYIVDFKDLLATVIRYCVDAGQIGGGGTWHLAHCNHPVLEFLAFQIAHRVFSRFDSASSKRSWPEIRRDSKVPRSWVRALGALRFAYIRS
ncbi:hypothetical protein D3C80_1003810 [compost metagenome]